MVDFPTSWCGAGRRFFDPGGRPGPGLPGFGALAGLGTVAWMFRKPRRTRAGVSRPGERAVHLSGRDTALLRCAFPERHRSMVRMFRWGSEGEREVVECHAEPVPAGDFGGDVVVATAEILHEGVTGGEDPR